MAKLADERPPRKKNTLDEKLDGILSKYEPDPLALERLKEEIIITTYKYISSVVKMENAK